MLRQRILYGTLMIVAIVGIVLLDAWLSKDAVAQISTGDVAGTGAMLRCALPVTLLVVFLAVLGTYEMAQLCRAGGYQPIAHWAALVSAGLAFIPWLEMQQRFAVLRPSAWLIDAHMPLTLWWLTGGLLGTCLSALLRKTTVKALGNMAVTMFLILYLGLLGSFAVRIRCMDRGPGGAALIVYFILTVKSSDIGAYFTGMAFGKHKLIPWLSPGKTVEGAVGAVAFAAVIGAVGMLLWRAFPALGPAPFSLPQALVFGAVMAITGHMGDLTESAFKRDVGAKDSGQVIPAFGGLLDLLDSPLFTAPIAWALLTI